MTEIIRKTENVYRFADSLCMKYIGTLILLTLPIRLIEKHIFGVENLSAIAAPLLFISALAVTILWTKLDLKANPSLFSGYITKQIKKGSIVKRVLLIILISSILKDITASMAEATKASTTISLYLLYACLTVGSLILIVSSVLILFRPTRRRKRR
jgi:TRAP-type C4-dicarboxylate transport system permease small subunit